MTKNKNLLGCSGKKRSGKNTIATIINKLTKKDNYYTNLGVNPPDDFNDNLYEEKSFAYLVKKFASELTGIPMKGWETEEDKAKFLGPEWDYIDETTGLKMKMTRRVMLKKLGSDACNQNLHRNTWINGLFQNYKGVRDFNNYREYSEFGSKWLITDVRFPQEVEAIKNRDGIVIRVIRPGKQDGDTHISETALDDYKDFDFVIINDGNLEELEEKVKNILIKIGLII